MKKFVFIFIFLSQIAVQLQAQTHRQALRQGHGAQTEQEIGQAVFTALKDNRFQNLTNYFPDEVEWRVLRRRSSEDMRLVLDRSSPEKLKENLQQDFNTIMQQAIGKGFNFTEWQLADVQGTRRDKKDPLLYTVKVNIANATGAEETIWFEAIKVRRRYYLFKQLIFKPSTEAGAKN